MCDSEDLLRRALLIYKLKFRSILMQVLLHKLVKPLVVNITNKAPHLSALGTYEIECISSGSRPETVITWWKGTHQVKHMARNVNILLLMWYLFTGLPARVQISQREKRITLLNFYYIFWANLILEYIVSRLLFLYFIAALYSRYKIHT